jgi:hypothetical protein
LAVIIGKMKLELELRNKPENIGLKFSSFTKNRYINIFEPGDLIERNNSKTKLEKVIIKEFDKGFFDYNFNKDWALLYGDRINIKILLNNKEYLSNISFRNIVILNFIFKRYYLLKEDNLRWLLNIFLIIMALILSYLNLKK